MIPPTKFFFFFVCLFSAGFLDYVSFVVNVKHVTTLVFFLLTHRAQAIDQQIDLAGDIRQFVILELKRSQSIQCERGIHFFVSSRGLSLNFQLTEIQSVKVRTVKRLSLRLRHLLLNLIPANLHQWLLEDLLYQRWEDLLLLDFRLLYVDVGDA